MLLCLFGEGRWGVILAQASLPREWPQTLATELLPGQPHAVGSPDTLCWLLLTSCEARLRAWLLAGPLAPGRPSHPWCPNAHFHPGWALGFGCPGLGRVPRTGSPGWTAFSGSGPGDSRRQQPCWVLAIMRPHWWHPAVLVPLREAGFPKPASDFSEEEEAFLQRAKESRGCVCDLWLRGKVLLRQDCNVLGWWGCQEAVWREGRPQSWVGGRPGCGGRPSGMEGRS